MSDLPTRVEAAKAAVFHACAVCRRVQARLDTLRTLSKDDNSPVTVADFASQAVIARTLAETLGDVVLVAEENADTLRQLAAAGQSAVIDAVLQALRPEWPSATFEEVLDAIDLGAADPPRDRLHGFWTLDPIDGTKGFLRGGQYAVSLAWIENGCPVIGVLGCPNLSKDLSTPLDEIPASGTVYYAVAAEGLFELPSDDVTASPLLVRPLERESDEPLRLCESVESGHTSHDDAELIMERMGELAEPVRLDGQGKYAVVARGQADIYMRLPRRSGYVERIWDHAAGAIVAIEAGCSVTDVAGNPLDFSHGRGLEKNRGILVAPPALHGRALGIMRSLGIPRPA